MEPVQRNQNQYQLSEKANFQSRHLVSDVNNQILATCTFWHADFTVTAEWATKFDFSNHIGSVIKFLIGTAAKLPAAEIGNLESEQTFSGIIFSLKDDTNITSIAPDETCNIEGQEISMVIKNPEFDPIVYLNQNLGLSASNIDYVLFESEDYKLYLNRNGRFSVTFLPIINNISDKFIHIFNSFQLMTESEQEQNQLEKFIADYLIEGNSLLDQMLRKLN
jgi:hypothetical protein